MYKHKPIPKTDIKLDGKLYSCNVHGILELPIIIDKYNPIDKKKEKKVVKKDKVDV